MSDKLIVPEIDRRKKESGIIRHIFETLVGKQSRKVAFGIWVFIVANGMKEGHADMPWDLWWKCVLLSGALIGLGTVLDELISKFGDKVVGVAAGRVNTLIETKTETVAAQKTTQTEAVP